MRASFIRATVAALVAATVQWSTPRPVGAQELTWFGSVGYATGAYIFAEQYRTFSLLNTLSWHAGRVTLSGTLPAVSQNGTAVSLVAGVPIPTGGPDNGAIQRRRSGQVIAGRGGRRLGGNSSASSARFNIVADTSADSLTVTGTGDYAVHMADPIFGGEIAVYEGTGAFRSLSLEAWAKAPVATVASGVGTGAWDFGAGASMTLGAKSAYFSASGTWWQLGDMPDLRLNDALMYAVAVGGTLGHGWSVMTSAAASTRIVDGTDPPASLSVMLSREVARGRSLSLSAGAGLTESAADYTIGFGWSATLFGDRGK